MQVFAEVYGPPPRLVVVGAVDTGRGALRGGEAARLAHGLRRRAGRLRDAGSASRARTSCSSSGRTSRSPGSAPTTARRSSSSPTTSSSTCPRSQAALAHGRVLRRRDRLAEDAGQAPRPARRGGPDGRAARANPRPRRPRPRRRHAGRDRRLDPHRGARRAGRARRHAAPDRARTASTPRSSDGATRIRPHPAHRRLHPAARRRLAPRRPTSSPRPRASPRSRASRRSRSCARRARRTTTASASRWSSPTPPPTPPTTSTPSTSGSSRSAGCPEVADFLEIDYEATA